MVIFTTFILLLIVSVIILIKVHREIITTLILLLIISVIILIKGHRVIATTLILLLMIFMILLIQVHKVMGCKDFSQYDCRCEAETGLQLIIRYILSG